MSRRAATASTSIWRSPSSAGSLAERPGGRGPPARAASGSGPGPGSGPPCRAPRRPRSAAAAGCARRRAGWRCRGGPTCASLLPAKRSLSARGERLGVLDLALADDAGLERRDRGTGHPAAGAVAPDLGRGDRSRSRCRGRRWRCRLGVESPRSLQVHSREPHPTSSAAGPPSAHTQDVMQASVAQLSARRSPGTSRASRRPRAGRRRRRERGRARRGSRACGRPGPGGR